MTRRTLLSSLSGLIALITGKTGLARPREESAPACVSGLSESITWHSIADEGPPPVVDERDESRWRLIRIGYGRPSILIASYERCRIDNSLHWITRDRFIYCSVTHWAELPHGPVLPARA